MADPVDERILQHLEAAIRGITKAAGYYYDMARVVDEPDGPFTDPQVFPAAAVYMTDEAPGPEERNISREDRSMNAWVEAWMRVQRPGARAQLSRLRADIYRAAFTDRTRGGLAIDTLLQGCLPAEYEGSNIHGYLIGFSINYRTVLGDPLADA